MEPDAVHELTTAYALDAVSVEEREAYEEHLARCAACRRELAELGDTATALAYAVDAPPPPDRLRARILTVAAAERSNVVPLRPRGALRAVGALAAVAACLAVGLGVWAASLSRTLDGERSARTTDQRALTILAQPDTRRIPLAGARGSLVVAPTGQAVLAVEGLPRAPAGKTYQAWVINGGVPRSAGTFRGGGDVTLVPLGRSVPIVATVSATLEDAPGATRPTGDRILTAGA